MKRERRAREARAGRACTHPVEFSFCSIGRRNRHGRPRESGQPSWRRAISLRSIVLRRKTCISEALAGQGRRMQKNMSFLSQRDRVCVYMWRRFEMARSLVSSADRLTALTRGPGALNIDNGIVTASHRKVEHGRRVCCTSRCALARGEFWVVDMGVRELSLCCGRLAMNDSSGSGTTFKHSKVRFRYPFLVRLRPCFG